MSHQHNNQPSQKHIIGLVIYPDMTQLDMTGPHQVFTSMPNTEVHLVWKSLEIVEANGGLKFIPTTTFNNCPALDIICVPGGVLGQVEMMKDREMLAFLQRQAKTAKYVTSVCTGSLILGAAGLLKGYKAASHWAFREQLALMGAEVSNDRVVIDRDRITGGGVTAGIDFGLTIAALLCGEETAKFIELMLEYNPAPPFGVGSPESAGLELVEKVKTVGASLIEASLEAIRPALRPEVPV
jgi:cyclohexyl-isocyanide hydratase